MKDHTTRRSLRSAIYTRVSTEQGLEQDFNSLDAQREASEAYIKSQSPLTGHCRVRGKTQFEQAFDQQMAHPGPGPLRPRASACGRDGAKRWTAPNPIKPSPSPPQDDKAGSKKSRRAIGLT